jgi:hypothetical protein
MIRLSLCSERKKSRSRSPRDKDRNREKERSERAGGGDRGARSRERGGDNRPPLKYKYWDVPPAGYEHMTPKEYKELQGSHLCFWHKGRVMRTTARLTQLHFGGYRLFIDFWFWKNRDMHNQSIHDSFLKIPYYTYIQYSNCNWACRVGTGEVGCQIQIHPFPFSSGRLMTPKVHTNHKSGLTHSLKAQTNPRSSNHGHWASALSLLGFSADISLLAFQRPELFQSFQGLGSEHENLTTKNQPLQDFFRSFSDISAL